MMLQHPGLGPSEISATALVPCLSPPGSLTLDDFTNFTPLVKEELRYAIQNKRLSNGMSTLTTDRACMNTDCPTELPVMKREVRTTHLQLEHLIKCYFLYFTLVILSNMHVEKPCLHNSLVHPLAELNQYH